MMHSIATGAALVILHISSPQFKNNDYIPSKFTCEGENISPEIVVDNIPSNTKTLAVILDDPDAPNGGFVHWVAWNITPAKVIAQRTVAGSMGKNGRGDLGYTGPCPPTGVHHYHFTIYALDTTLDLSQEAGKEELVTAMKGHVLGSGELIGLYKKTK
jgi:Raf kinase inhibitor-like YbhB/YbcL family protein